MSRHRMMSECGMVTVTVEPSDDAADRQTCGIKIPVRIRVSRGRGKTWAPRAPLCVPDISGRDPTSRKGARRAAEDAVAFFEERKCQPGFDGAKRRRR